MSPALNGLKAVGQQGTSATMRPALNALFLASLSNVATTAGALHSSSHRAFYSSRVHKTEKFWTAEQTLQAKQKKQDDVGQNMAEHLNNKFPNFIPPEAYNLQGGACIGRMLQRLFFDKIGEKFTKPSEILGMAEIRLKLLNEFQTPKSVLLEIN